MGDLCRAASFGDKHASAWALRPRQRCREFEPLPVRTALPGLKTVEQDLQEQVKHVHREVQQDLDLLHGQIINDIYKAVSQELHAVAARLASIRGDLGKEHDGLKTMLGQLQQETHDLQAARLEDRKDTLEAAQQAAARAGEDARAAWTAEAAALQQKAQDVDDRLRSDLAEVRGLLDSRGAEVERASSGRCGQLEASLKDSAAALEQRLDRLAEDLRSALGEESAERLGLKAALEQGRASSDASMAQLEEGLRGEALVCEARFREAQAAVAALEDRLQASLREALHSSTGQSEQAGLRAKYELEALRETVAADVREQLVTQERQLKQLGAECREELGFVRAGLARGVEWDAAPDAAAAEAGGRLDQDSPVFSAAGLRGLRLVLRLARQADGQRWACGVFLRAPHGKVSFRLGVLGRTMSFAGEFGETSEWGSAKLAILERIPQKLPVTLELLDVSAPLAKGVSPAGAPTPVADELRASVHIADAGQAAARETATLRAAMVRKVEWRIAKVSERLAAAREAAASIGDEDALEPLCSPPFAAAGYEGLQLQLYPLGYRPKSDQEACGFFLVCPRGLQVKCRAFVGDAVRTFEHKYDSGEPYGRGNFCRLAEKTDADDCVVCGVEFLEVRQEQTTQVRGGPFGNIADQLKIVSSPGVAGMEAVRELRELPPGDGRKVPNRGKTRACAPSGPAAMRCTAPGGMHDSKSLPSLLPHVPTAVAAPPSAPGLQPSLSPPAARPVDAMKFR